MRVQKKLSYSGDETTAQSRSTEKRPDRQDFASRGSARFDQVQFSTLVYEYVLQLTLMFADLKRIRIGYLHPMGE